MVTINRHIYLLASIIFVIFISFSIAGATYADEKIILKDKPETSEIVLNDNLQLLEFSESKVELKVLEKLNNNEKVYVIVQLKEETPTQLSTASLEKIRISEEQVIAQIPENEFEIRATFSIFPGFSGLATKEAIEALQNNPNVERIEYNGLMKTALYDSASQINAKDVWNLQFNNQNITGKNQTVCVIDTGANYSHPALGGCTNDSFLAGTCGKVLGGYDFVTCAEYNINNECIETKLPDSDPMDDEGHGSHVAGIVASNDTTYRGIAPDANIVIVKVMNKQGKESYERILEGIDWCIGNATKYNIKSITTSFGGNTTYSTACDANSIVAKTASKAAANGILVAAASNNLYNDSGVTSPACGINVTSVAAVDSSDDVLSSSNVGPNLDLYAPGLSITSVQYNTGSFTSKSGTSMAAPHVAGAALLMQQYEKLESNTSLTPQQIENIFKSTGKNITSRGYTIPRIDIKAAIQAIDDTPPANASDLNNVGAGFSNITINWTNPLDTDFNHVEVWANGILRGNTSNNSYTITGLLANTTYEIQIKTVDDSLNINDTFVGMNITTLADTEAPRIYLISPQNNSNISQGTVIDLEAYDNGEISSLWYSKNNGTNQTSASPYDIDTSTWTSGAVYLKVWANDTGNNVNATGFFFNVNSSAPVVTNVNILPADADNSDDLTCNYTYYDADNNTESNDTIIKWYTDGNESTGFENLTLVSQTNTTRGQRWNCSVTPHDGIVYGTTVMSGEVTIQNAAPAVTITYPNGGETLANVTMATWTASDYENDSLGYFAYYRMNSSSSWTAITGCSNITVTNCTWNTSLVSNGASYRLGANATDIFGASSFDMSNTDFAINNTVTNETGGSGNGGDGGETQTTTTTELLAAGGGPAPQPEGGTAAVEAAEVTTNETTTETPAITGAASLVDLLKGNAGTALVIGVITALIVLALVLFTKRGKGKVGKYKSI